MARNRALQGLGAFLSTLGQGLGQKALVDRRRAEEKQRREENLRNQIQFLITSLGGGDATQTLIDPAPLDQTPTPKQLETRPTTPADMFQRAGLLKREQIQSTQDRKQALAAQRQAETDAEQQRESERRQFEDERRERERQEDRRFKRGTEAAKQSAKIESEEEERVVKKINQVTKDIENITRRSKTVNEQFMNNPFNETLVSNPSQIRSAIRGRLRESNVEMTSAQIDSIAKDIERRKTEFRRTMTPLIEPRIDDINKAKSLEDQRVIVEEIVREHFPDDDGTITNQVLRFLKLD